MENLYVINKQTLSGKLIEDTEFILVSTQSKIFAKYEQIYNSESLFKMGTAIF